MRWVALAVVACGGGGTSTPDALTPEPDAAIPVTVNEAAILIAETSMGGSDVTFELAGFDSAPFVITAHDFGACHFEDSTKMGDEVLQDGGTVTIAGGSASDIVMMPDAQDHYSDQMAGFTYAAGDVLTVSTSGATAPAISGMLTFPATVAVTGRIPVTFPKADFTVAWMPVDTPVHVVFTQFPDTVRSLVVDCTFDGSAGSGMIPGAALAGLLDQRATIAITGEVRQGSMVGDYTVTLVAIDGESTFSVTMTE